MNDQQEFFIILLGIIALVIVYAILGAAIEHYHFYYIHQTGVGIIIGVFFGVCVYFLHDFSEFSFDEQLFFLALLPAMIFSGGYNLKKRQFFKNIKYILIYGLFGTLVSFFVIFGLTYLINHLNLIIITNFSSNDDSSINTQYSNPINLSTNDQYPEPYPSSFTTQQQPGSQTIAASPETVILSLSLIIKFSATICATDSVAALTLIKPSQHPKLFSVIFGQGMVNDAVAIILFKVVGGVFDSLESIQLQQSQYSPLNSPFPSQQSTSSFDVSTLFQIIWQFIYTVIVSLFIGTSIAILSTYLFKRFEFLTHNPICQVVVIYLFGILSYLIAEILEMSGVLAVLVAGVTLAHFNFYNMTMTGQIASGITYQSIAFIAEAIVFIYLGLSFMFYITEYSTSVTFFALELIVCIISRLTAIFGLAMLFKICSKWVLSANQMVIISTAGTIRGSVAFALILTIEEEHDATDEQKIAIEIIKSTVLFMVFVTTLVLGGSMPWFIKKFLKVKVDSNNDDHERIGTTDDDALKQSIKISFLNKDGQNQQQSESEDEKPKSCFKVFDENFLKKWLIRNYVNRKSEIRRHKQYRKMNSPDYKGAEYVEIFKAAIRDTIIKERQTIIGNRDFKSGTKGNSLLESNQD